MKPLLEIVKLNQTRYGLDFDGQEAIDKLHEEIIKEFKPAVESNDIDEMVDALTDTVVVAVGELTKLGSAPRPLPTYVNRELVAVEHSTLDKLVDALDQFKSAVFTDNQSRMINLLYTIVEISAEGLLELKYHPVLTLKQVVKTISSRVQDPIQAQAWATGNRQPGEKWKKFKDQDPSTLYTADFSTCKIK